MSQLLVNFAGTEPAGTRPPFPPKGVWPAVIARISPAKDDKTGGVKGLWVTVEVDPSAGLQGKAGGSEYFGLDFSKSFNKEKMMKLVMVGTGYTKEQLQAAGNIDLGDLVSKIPQAKRRVWIKCQPQNRSERDEVTGQVKWFDDLDILTDAEAADEKAAMAASASPATPVGASLGSAPASLGALPPMGGSVATPAAPLGALPPLGGTPPATGNSGLPPIGGGTASAMAALVGQ